MTTSHTPPFVREWLDTLQPAAFDTVAPEPGSTAIFTSDVINGFLRFGALSSPRIDAITGPIVDLFRLAHAQGVERFVLLQDAHDPNTPEFRSYPPHCIAGTEESDMIPELADMPFADTFTVIEKNSLSPAIETSLDAWWDENRDLTTAIVVGNCTDLCVYQLAMHLRMRANALNLDAFNVFVPVNAVDTFDIVAGNDARIGTSHPGDFFHDVFLYHMAQNGIRIVREIVPAG